MKALVAPDKEPITAFVLKIRPLFRDLGVSSILVVGGSGDFFTEADAVIMMDEPLSLHKAFIRLHLKAFKEVVEVKGTWPGT